MRQYLLYPCHSLFLAFSLIFCSGPGANYCHSQEQPDPPGVATSETSSEEEDEWWKISFPGGTIDEYLKVIRDTAPKEHYPDINVVVVESASGFELPRIEATTTLDGFLGCLEACSTDRYQVSITTDERTGDITIIRVTALNAPPSVRVFNVRQILQSVNEEDFVQAIQTALEFAESIEGIEMKLHTETGLLFAKGPFAGLEAIEDTIRQLMLPPPVVGDNITPGSGNLPSPGGSGVPAGIGGDQHPR